MTTPHDRSQLLSKAALLAAVDQLINAEQERTGSPWVSRQRLCDCFFETYGIDLEAFIASGQAKGLRSVLANSQRYAIYPTSRPWYYYLARRQAVVPGTLQSGRPAPQRRVSPDGRHGTR